jgi:Holliday junction resolvase
MVRKGYGTELEAKKKLMLQYGMHNVIKVAIGSFGSDYIIVGKGKLIKCVECKECHGKKYYPLPDEKKQLQRILDFCNEHEIKCELWIKYVSRNWEIKDLKDYLTSTSLANAS